MPSVPSSLIPSDHILILLLGPLLLSFHWDVRSSGRGSGRGTSGCLVGLCLLSEVFSQIAAFHSLAWQVTPLCACLRMCACLGMLWNPSSLWIHPQFVHILNPIDVCMHLCVLLLPYYERLFTMLSCVCLEWELPLAKVYLKPSSQGN